MKDQAYICPKAYGWLGANWLGRMDGWGLARAKGKPLETTVGVTCGGVLEFRGEIRSRDREENPIYQAEKENIYVARHVGERAGAVVAEHATI